MSETTKTQKFYAVMRHTGHGNDQELGLVPVAAEQRPRDEPLAAGLLLSMGLELQGGDEVEITARVVSRVYTERRPVE